MYADTSSLFRDLRAMRLTPAEHASVRDALMLEVLKTDAVSALSPAEKAYGREALLTFMTQNEPQPVATFAAQTFFSFFRGSNMLRHLQPFTV